VASVSRVYAASNATTVRQDVAWLPAIRWITVTALWAAGLTLFLPADVDFPLRAIAPLALAAAICRSVLMALPPQQQGVTSVIACATLAADAALLTGLLDITGGPFNPFIVAFAVLVWLAVVGGSPAAGILVGTVAAAGFGWLLFDHLRAEHLEHHRLNDFPSHLFTMWVAGAATAELVAHYVRRSRAALAAHQQQLDAARGRAIRSERLAALTTLAAGAAHELSTPLATIAVASRELQRSAGRLHDSEPVATAIRDDAGLIRAEIDRCHRILDGMSGRAADWTAAGPSTAGAVVALACSRLPADLQQRVRLSIDADTEPMPVDSPAVAQALTSLLRNALDASPNGEAIDLRVAGDATRLRFEVQDRGEGMTAAVRERAGEPFFTTKPGRGMGLGLFLARSIAEQAGGFVELSPGPGTTTAVLELPSSARGVAS
jgi:two-component system, sensor histidine kinase RegB